MAEDADTKARRRRRIQESFPPPLNGIALRHVDSVQALNETQRAILASVLQKAGLARLVTCLQILRNRSVKIEDESGLMEQLLQFEQAPRTSIQIRPKRLETNSRDAEYLAGLLIDCYPDMPISSAN